ncbi:hypothetical protein GCK72_007287 [Caenorhabditis remanei]|uniref:Uncharacterized protein n=1 Tax=Caenorhabditis remanei TaxID=31234 RepID=A0A6A5HHK9_CAERE|nr:hypothetical protein GCK72_007287 [Caenorhabditis remanei]KAF1767328.1 hypothetical protein GCK72_007287 [Caenorhabditis remanei]
MHSPSNHFYSAQEFPLQGEDSLTDYPNPQYEFSPNYDLPAEEYAISSHGNVTWLSAVSGLISCENGDSFSFQITDFCDEKVSDLRKVLRIGMVLGFRAIEKDDGRFVINYVYPLSGIEAEIRFKKMEEIDLTPGKDEYELRLEGKAFDTLLDVFRKDGSADIGLRCLHGSGKEEKPLHNYIGTSGEKLRQFVTSRTHIFRLEHDFVSLQLPSVYLAVKYLNTYLLQSGGAISIEDLYNFYISHLFPNPVRKHVGFTPKVFMNLLKNHPFVFSVFPSEVFVSSRRNLPQFDYPMFIDSNFPFLEPREPDFVQAKQEAYPPSVNYNNQYNNVRDDRPDSRASIEIEWRREKFDDSPFPTYDGVGPFALLVAATFGPRATRSTGSSEESSATSPSGSSNPPTSGTSSTTFPDTCEYNLFGPNDLLRECLDSLCSWTL